MELISPEAIQQGKLMAKMFEQKHVASKKEKLILKEEQYAERRFNQLLDEVDQIHFDLEYDQIMGILKKLDEIWRAFCEHLIYLSPEGKDEFMKVARERAFKTITIEK